MVGMLSHPLTSLANSFIRCGYLGTNDCRYLLPLSVKQQDLKSQLHTNAKVLSKLLQPENEFYICTQSKDGERLSGRKLLKEIANFQLPNSSNRRVQVIIDVGAQVLDMDNKTAAYHWLNVAIEADPSSQWTGALFLDENHELKIIEKEGVLQASKSSSYVTNMETCVVYLDEVHTRGTDITLPEQSVAAVTLGPRLTKDKLVQDNSFPIVSNLV